MVLSVPRRAGKTSSRWPPRWTGWTIGRDARAGTPPNAARTPPNCSATSGRRCWTARRSAACTGCAGRKGPRGSQARPARPGCRCSRRPRTRCTGQNADTVTVDEAWSFDIDTGEALEAGIRPAQLTRPWRQLWIVSAGGTIESTWWDRWLTAGEQGTAGVALFDYGADPAAPGYDPGNPAVWAAAHPTAGYGFPSTRSAHEWATRRDDASFERAYLNVWPRPSLAVAAAGLELAAWAAAAHPAPPRPR